MKRFSVLIVLLSFLFFGIGKAQTIDTQEVGGWRKTAVNGNAQSVSTIIDTTTQSFDIILQNYDDSAYVIWGKKLDRAYSIPAYDTSRPHDTYATILWNAHYEGAGPDQYTAIFYQFFIGTGSGMHPLAASFLDIRSASYWQNGGSQTNFYPNPPETMDSVALKVFTNGTYAKANFRGIKIQYGHNSESGTYFIDSIITVNIFGDKATAIDVSRETLPQTFQLSQNYPNPFNPTTSIRYQVVGTTHVRLAIYDVLGREVTTLVNEEKPAGEYSVTFDGIDLSSGTYFYRLQTDNGFAETKKMVLMK